MAALTVRCLSNLATPEEPWSGTWESNPVISASQAQRISVFLVPEIQFLEDLVGPSGLEPESQASETCALSSWTMDRSGTGVGNRTRIPGLGNRRSVQLNYARSGWGGRRKSNPRGRFHRPPPNHSATATLGARSTSRTCLSSFSDWCLDRNGLPGEFGGRGGS